LIGIDKIDLLKIRLQEPLPGLAAQNKMAARVRELPAIIPENAKLSAVLAILFPKNNVLNLVLIKRVDDGKPHSGQISFPGGRKDASDAYLADTALRETFEEVGIPSQKIQILGELTSLYIPVSYSQVHPFIGYMPHQPEYELSTNEVQYTLEVPLHEFFAPEKKIVTKITPAAFPDITLTAPAYQWDAEHLIWGATAMIISELEELFTEG
jgi:8-oxo-dGTP pyrophosphatase MutT (NUDIX family)